MNTTQKADDKSLDFRKNKQRKQILFILFFFGGASNIKVYAYMDSKMKYIRKDTTLFEKSVYWSERIKIEIKLASINHFLKMY